MPSHDLSKSHKGLLAGLMLAATRGWKRWRSTFGRDHYRPEKHYMRGPGPKAKRSGGDTTPDRA